MHHQLIQIQEAIHGILSPVGFKKHKTIWTRTLPDVLQLVALDKGSNSSRYWFEFGVNVRRICDDPQPLFYKLHIRWGDSQLMPEEERKSWTDIYNLDKLNISAESRAAKYADVAGKYVLPTLALVDSVD